MAHMKNDNLERGDKIEVYRNLHKDCFSIRKNGRVVLHVFNDESLNMSDVRFAVQPAGHAKVIRDKRKNVHAFIRGVWAGPTLDCWQAIVSYNPYKYDFFFTSFGGNDYAIYESRRVTLKNGKVYANG
tara:strand:- start:456 stop:839 length:384 start_codon:yes stop_codon:yes gene_type:complete